MTAIIAATRVQERCEVRRTALSAINFDSCCDINRAVDVVVATEIEIARAPLESLADILAAAGVLAEMVLAGPAADGRDLKLARNLMAAITYPEGA